MHVAECKKVRSIGITKAILLKSSIGVGTGNTFCQSIVNWF